MKERGMDRREFISHGLGGAAAIVVGPKVPRWLAKSNAVIAATQTLNLALMDGVKEMVTHNAANNAECYFWLFKSTAPAIDAEVPGPTIFAFEGDTITINLRNNLPTAHRFAIPSMEAKFPGLGPFTSSTMAAGTPATPTTTTLRFTLPAGSAGSYLYYDDLNAPVNRVMGLHGAFIVMPNPANGTPYGAADVTANPRMAQLFADLGAKPWWPGLAWGEGAANPAPFPATPAFRQYIWLLHQPSPLLFQEVGIFSFNNPGVNYPAQTFLDKFLNDPLITQGANKAPVENNTPEYFTISGQSGHFSHNSPFVCPNLRVGEPCIIRVLNAGLWCHSMHIHANHVYVLAVNNQFSAQDVLPGQRDNHIWIDTFTSKPLDTWDWLNPYMRPPDVPNNKGIGRADLEVPLPVDPTPIPNFGVIMVGEEVAAGDTPPGVATWPPTQEMFMAIPRVGTMAGVNPIHVQLSPLCFPMHDHSEPSQTAQGGNYNLGLIAGMNFTGDRNADGNLPGGVLSFPNIPEVFGPNPNVSPQAAAGPLPPFPEIMNM
ncbi:multicopper oxidase domain-containing protein [Candidatus Poribacteria bacterium]|nr:multicopper oxidase domain-containing protein [Candidatus Poribacteria bacterium]